MAEASSFFASVYALVAQIPPGFVASYGQLARMLGAPRAARQVGWAMRRCPDALPWQRVVRQDGTLDRRALAAAAFATPENAQKLNAVTHPAILRETARRRQALAADPAVRAVLLDAPLLWESGLDRQCDRVIAVIAPEEVRLDRIRRRDGLPEEAVLRRFLRQQPEEFYTSRADLVLDTGGGQPLAALVQQAKRQLEEWCDR